MPRLVPGAPGSSGDPDSAQHLLQALPKRRQHLLLFPSFSWDSQGVSTRDSTNVRTLVRLAVLGALLCSKSWQGLLPSYQAGERNGMGLDSQKTQQSLGNAPSLSSHVKGVEW